METTFGRRADELIELAHKNLVSVRVLRHEDSIERWRVNLTGHFRDYLVHVSEISANEKRTNKLFCTFNWKIQSTKLLGG